MARPLQRCVSGAVAGAVVASCIALGVVAAAPPASAAIVTPSPVAAGDDHSCALTATGGVRCWGANQSGQLGNGTTVPSAVPVDVLGLTSGVVSLAAGADHTCAILTTGALRCWGKNTTGQLGDGRTVDALVSVPVKTMSSGVTSVTAGSGHTCALTTVGAARCWGRNSKGQLGNGTTTDALEPIEVAGLSAGTRGISAGRTHTCAVTPAGAATCWGENFTGESDPTGGMGSVVYPKPVSGVTANVTAVSAGSSHSCALLASTGVTCWGSNESRQLGRDSSGYAVVPGLVPDLTGVTALAAGQRHQCALANGQAVCWGDNNLG